MTFNDLSGFYLLKKKKSYELAHFFLLFSSVRTAILLEFHEFVKF